MNERSPDELYEYLWEEYYEYIEDTPMTSYERRLLRKWVSEGHSVFSDPGSKYLCDPYPPRTFLEAVREDRQIAKDLKGLSDALKMEYLKSYMSYDD